MPFALSLFLLLLFLAFLWTIVRWLAGIHGGAPFVPVPRRWLDEAFSLQSITAKDTVIDLGSGSGTILLAAARQGARVIGYEFHPLLVLLSRWRLRHYGERAIIHRGDLFTADLSQATIVTIFGLDSMREKLIPFLSERLRPGTSLIVFLAPELPYEVLAKGNCVTVYRFPPNAA